MRLLLVQLPDRNRRAGARLARPAHLRQPLPDLPFGSAPRAAPIGELTNDCVPRRDYFPLDKLVDASLDEKERVFGVAATILLAALGQTRGRLPVSGWARPILAAALKERECRSIAVKAMEKMPGRNEPYRYAIPQSTAQKLAKLLVASSVVQPRPRLTRGRTEKKRARPRESAFSRTLAKPGPTHALFALTTPTSQRRLAVGATGRASDGPSLISGRGSGRGRGYLTASSFLSGLSGRGGLTFGASGRSGRFTSGCG